MERLVRLVLLVLLLGAPLTGCGGGEEPEGNPLAADSAFRPNTDTVAGRLSERQVDEIVRRCRKNAGIPGGGGECASSLPQSLAPCRPTDRWCLTGDVTGGGVGSVQIVDQGGDEPTCDPRLCTPIEVPDHVVGELVRGQRVSLSPVPTLVPTPTDTTSPSEGPSSGAPSAGTPGDDSPTPDGATPEEPTTRATP